ncbi:MAG: arginase [Reichenbachiella sp.]|uniref:arginase n=1 Tax=Reichenbachiella sp. TaxID=2184521 RepID=UPI0029667668|nr:arginase [Reichenbachiella sp.]MDW3212038.1 arginase [Reichenbachiella sp.]
MSICIIENKSELGAGTRGASLCVDAIRMSALAGGSDFFQRHQVNTLIVPQDDLYKETRHPFAKRIDGIKKVYEMVSREVSKNLLDQQLPIIISGDHSSAGGTLAGIKKAYPDSRLGVVWIDAHADMHSPYTTPSGNVHGMPLAAALGWDNKEAKCNEVDTETQQLWDELKSVGTSQPKVSPENLLFVGVRDTERAEDLLIKQRGVTNYKVDEIRTRGASVMARRALEEKFADCDMIYLSLDVDGMDCEATSYGTGTPVKNGLLKEEVKEFIQVILESGKVCAFELVEVNPLLDDKGNKMAEIALEILEFAESILTKLKKPVLA